MFGFVLIKQKAAILPTVLIVCLLMLISVFVLLSLYDMDSLYYYEYHSRKQQYANMNSACILYCNDSSFSASCDETGRYRLYPEEVASDIYLNAYPWGLYEVVEIFSHRKKFSVVKLIGKYRECNYCAALWLCDRNRSVSISGKTKISGSVYMPVNGVNYTQIRSEYYKGEPVPASDIALSGPELPSSSHSFSAGGDSLRRDVRAGCPDIREASAYYSFHNPAKYFEVGESMENVRIGGKVVIYGERVEIGKNCNLEDVILCASHVVIGEGFNGSLQIFAKDTVLLKRRVRLNYPSGIYLAGDISSPYIYVGNDCEINGYVVLRHGNKDEESMPSANYVQDSLSVLRGLLYVDGIADVRGKISGAAYIWDCFYFSPEGYYAGTLYDAGFIRNNRIAYPIFMEGDYKRKEIKSLY